MYSLEQIQAFIKQHLANARKFQSKRKLAEELMPALPDKANELNAAAEEMEIRCRDSVQQARKWHQRYLVELGFSRAQQAAWLNGAQLP